MTKAIVIDVETDLERVEKILKHLEVKPPMLTDIGLKEWLATEDAAAHLRKSLLKAERIGATGAFPEGKLKQDDEGELQLALVFQADKLVFQFGKSIQWMAMTKAEALNLADGLARLANELPG